MMAVFTDDSTQTHGTHVAGIAAGCGAPSGDGTKYKGIAPGADLVFVSTTLSDPTILDAIQYIYNYAHSVGKPCVINMSFGDDTGPHDGTSACDRFLTEFVASHPDSIAFVCAAGNSGNNKIHLTKQFSPSDTLMVTELEKQISSSDNPVYEVDIWNETNFRLG
jgi:subtilisin family serine protease